jgi:hypothetical protein
MKFDKEISNIHVYALRINIAFVSKITNKKAMRNFKLFSANVMYFNL